MYERYASFNRYGDLSKFITDPDLLQVTEDESVYISNENDYDIADALWIDTVFPVSKIEELVEKSGVAEPSDISFVKDSDEIGNGSIWIVTQEEQNPKVIERTDHKQINHMIMLYWD